MRDSTPENTGGQQNPILRRIKQGPQTTGLLEMFVGMVLWWRMWAVSALVSLPFFAAVLTANYYSWEIAALVGAAVGLVAGGKIIGVSPKYDVTKNY